MFEQALAAITVFNSKILKRLLKFAEENPSDPILEDDGKKDIPADVYDSLRQGKKVFVCRDYPQLRYSTWLPAVVSQEDITRFFPKNAQGEHVADWIGVNNFGLCVYGAKEYRHKANNIFGWRSMP